MNDFDAYSLYLAGKPECVCDGGTYQITYTFVYRPSERTHAAELIADMPQVRLSARAMRRANQLGRQCCAALARLSP